MILNRLERTAIWTEKKASLIFTVILVTTLFVSLMNAAVKPLWFDELFTWYIAQIDGFKRFFSAFGPMDPCPPLHHLLVRGTHRLFGSSEIITRLPAISGFLLALLFLFKILRIRTINIFGLSAILFLCDHKIASYAYEARGYSWILAFSTISFYCWQRATEDKNKALHLTGLALALTGAIYTHFYATLLFLPIIFGEVFRTLTTKRIDFRIWLTLLCSAVTFIPLLPMVKRCMSLAPNFWAAPTSERITNGISYIYSGSLQTAFILLCCIFLSKFVFCKNKPQNQEVNQSPPVHEIAAAFMLAILPIFGIIISILVTNAFHPRYFMAGILGSIIFLFFAFSKLISKHSSSEMLIASFLLFSVLFIDWAENLPKNIALFFKHQPPIYSSIIQQCKIKKESPVIIQRTHQFLQTYHYSDIETKQNLFYLLHSKKEETGLVSLIELTNFFDLNITPLKTFLRQKHSDFYVVYKDEQQPVIQKLLQITASQEQLDFSNKTKCVHMTLE